MLSDKRSGVGRVLQRPVKGQQMNPETLGGIVGVVIVAYYLMWRFSMFRYIFRRSGQILRHLTATKF